MSVGGISQEVLLIDKDGKPLGVVMVDAGIRALVVDTGLGSELRAILRVLERIEAKLGTEEK